MAASARSAALAGLKAQRTQGTWPDQFVKNQLPGFALEGKDAALVEQMVQKAARVIETIYAQ